MKIKNITLITGVLLFILSCSSQPSIYNPENIREDDLVTLYIDRYCKIQRVDNILADWLPSNNKTKIVKIPVGLHTFYARYDDGNAYTRYYAPLTAQFERGNTYLLNYSQALESNLGVSVSFSINLYNNKKKGLQVSFKPVEESDSILVSYLKLVLQPMEKGKSVKLENDKYQLVFKSDSGYTFFNKETGITGEGSYRFPIETESRLQVDRIGKMFLFDSYIIARSSQMYLSNNFTENPQIILIPIKVTETEITYLYEKPLELRGTEIKFNITTFD
jgi:hypothetical protein